MPSKRILDCFGSSVQPLLNKIVVNAKEISTLATLRDTLLPKLISGELRVPNAEKFVEEAGL